MGKCAAFTKIVLVAWMAVAVTAEVELTPTPAPAPAPAPEFLNLTDLLELAGPFKTFLSLLESTDLLKSIQAQANDTQHGVTMFAPSDPAFASLKASALGNLTVQQKKAVLLSHVMPKFYTLQDFQNFSNPATTMATGMDGGKYNLNITSKSGAVSLSTGHVTAPITSTVHVTYPVAVYTVPKVLLPQDIFGVATPSPSPSPSPSPPDVPTASPEASADAPSADAKANAPAESTASGAPLIHNPMVLLMLLGSGALMLL